MFLHLGQDTVVKFSDIVGIFDMDTTTVQKNSRTFLNKSEKKGEVVNVSFELPKSFVLCSKKGKSKVYITQISSSTLQKRAENKDINVF